MMRYTDEFFDAGLYRPGTDCVKWDLCRREHGEDALPMWVADMDFPSPAEVTEALLRRAAHPTYGYTELTEKHNAALRAFWAGRHGLSPGEDAVTLLPCVISGLKTAIHALTQPGDPVVIMSPVYGPFRFSVEATSRRLADAPLKKDGAGRYGMDLDAVEARLREGARLVLLCSPHNPVGRAWTREELAALMAVCGRYGAYVCSDEIHADFVFAPGKFVPLLSVRKERVISLCAPSKTFNLAGLQIASALCEDAPLRERFRRTLEANGVTSGNLMGLVAAEAAYAHGGGWLDGLMRYLDGNRAALAAAVAESLPGAMLSPLESTYLGWLDLTAYGFTCEELAKRTEKAGVIFTGGTFFGEEAGEGHLRINIACPRRHIPEAVRRLKKALEQGG